MNAQEQIMYDVMQAENELAAIKIFCEGTAKTDSQLAEALQSPDKSYDKCWAYINERAKKHLDNKSGGLPPNLVFGWVIHYFIEKNETLETEIGSLKVVKMKEKESEPQLEKVSMIKTKDTKAKVQNKKVERNFELISIFDLPENMMDDCERCEEPEEEEDDE